MKFTLTPFQLNTQIANALAAVAEAVGKLLADTRSVTLTASDRLEFARSIFKNTAFSRKDYQIYLKNISNATASRDSKHGVNIGWLQKTGEKRKTTYAFNQFSGLSS
jgi:Fic family protein